MIMQFGIVPTDFRLWCGRQRSRVCLNPIAELVNRRTVKFVTNVAENQFLSEVVQLGFSDLYTFLTFFSFSFMFSFVFCMLSVC